MEQRRGCWLANRPLWRASPAVNEVYRRYFPENPPARIFISVPAWYGGFDIEVDCIAAVLWMRGTRWASYVSS